MNYSGSGGQYNARYNVGPMRYIETEFVLWSAKVVLPKRKKHSAFLNKQSHIIFIYLDLK